MPLLFAEMGWKGIACGAVAGFAWGGYLGAACGAYFGHQVEESLRQKRAQTRARARTRPAASRDDSLSDAYATLGVSPSASDDAVRRAYREKAKKCHPDVLRAQGGAEARIAQATAHMTRINAAWNLIRKYRQI